MLARSFLIKSSSELLVTRTGIKAWSSLFLGRIRPLILELLVWKFHLFVLEYLWSQLANLQIVCVAYLRLRFCGRLDQIFCFHGNRKPRLTYHGENDVSTISRLVLIRSFFILAGKEDVHKILDEFEFRPDRTTDYGVSCPWGLKIFDRIIMGKWCLHASLFIFDRIIIKVAGNHDRHKSLDELVSGLWFPWPIYMFFEMRFDLRSLDSGERSLPFGLLVGQTLRLFHTSCVRTVKAQETVQMRRLAWAFVGRLCDKYHNLMSWLIYKGWSINLFLFSIGSLSMGGFTSFSVIINSNLSLSGRKH